MFQKMLTGALGAGVAAWLLAAVLHFAFVQPYILLGEQYESGAAEHFAGVAHGDDHAADAAVTEGDTAVAEDHDHAAGSDESSGLTRDFWTVVFFGLVYVGYAMVLVAGFGLASAYGKTITAREGILWGIAGFAVFQLAPAMGLAPELPGTMAADLADRQVWWWGTSLATALGLASIAYGRGVAALAVGVALLAAPYVIGAPELDGFSGVAPPEVAAAFSARVLGAALAVWALMGWVAGYLWSGEAA
jgi:cobalt transporter subunit CbtA